MYLFSPTTYSDKQTDKLIIYNIQGFFVALCESRFDLAVRR